MCNDEVIQKLYIELRALSQKIDDLRVFLKTKKFSNIEAKNKLQASLLETQLRQMNFYKDTLIWRISNLKDGNN